jgi:hypothetical protein
MFGAAKLEKVALDGGSDIRDETYRDEHREVIRCLRSYRPRK